MNGERNPQSGLSDLIAYAVLLLVVLLTIGISIWQVKANSVRLQEEKTVFAMQSRLQGYFINQLTKYKEVKFEDQGLLKNLPRRDELVNLVTFLELIDQKTGNLSTIKVDDTPVDQDGYPYPGVRYTIDLRGSLSSFSEYLGYLETLPYYYLVQKAAWEDVANGAEALPADVNKGQIQLLVFMKNG